MALLDQVLGNVSLPSHVGTAYNTATKTGSWIDSGVKAYKNWADDQFLQAKLYIDRYLNFERDPAKLLWYANLLLRADPVKLPKPVDGDSDWTWLKRLTESLVGDWTDTGEPNVLFPDLYDGSDTVKIPMRDGDLAVSTVFDYSSDKEVPEDFLNNSESFSEAGKEYYGKIYTLYGKSNEIELETPNATNVENALNELGASYGYKNLGGFEPGSDHMWDIQLYPYYGPNTELISEDRSYTFTPELPSYKIPNVMNPEDIENPSVSFSFGKYCPVVSYNIQYGSLNTMSIKLHNESSIDIPTGFGFKCMINLSILDDVHGSMIKYMNKYINSIYDATTGRVARYDQAAFVIRLLVYKPGFRVKHEFQFIAVPSNYTPSYEGNNSANEELITIDFSVVGMKNLTASNQSLHQNGADVSDELSTLPTERGDWENTSWSDVMIYPTNGEL